MYNGKECSSEVKFNMKSGISADIILQTPWMDDITVSFLHQGQPLSFTSKLEIGYSGSIKHNIQLVFNFNQMYYVLLIFHAALIHYNQFEVEH
jgi:hypothetical protein